MKDKLISLVIKVCDWWGNIVSSENGEPVNTSRFVVKNTLFNDWLDKHMD